MLNESLLIFFPTINDLNVLLNVIFDHFKQVDEFDTLDIIDLIREKPWLFDINGEVRHHHIHVSLESEKEDVIQYCTKHGLNRVKEKILNLE